MCKALISLLFCRPSSRSTVLFLFFTVVRGGGNSSSCPPFSPSFFYPLFLNPFSSCIVSPPSHILSSSSRVPSSPCHFPIISSSTFHCLLISLLSPHHPPIISPSSPHHFPIISPSSPHHLLSSVAVSLGTGWSSPCPQQPGHPTDHRSSNSS